MRIVIFGLSVTSSWGNGHATTYRALLKALHVEGHSVLFCERDVPWYAGHRDLPAPPFCELALYHSVGEARERFAEAVRTADAVIVGSYVPDGVAIGEWATATAGGVSAFYDIDTPVTLAKLAAGDFEYLAPDLIPRYDLYLSFTGGPTLRRLEQEFGSPAARPLYCSVDPDLYQPDDAIERDLDLGYLGTWSADRQPTVNRFLIEPARALPERRFAVAGPQYPAEIDWPANVERTDHLPPAEHARFYNRQRFTLNVTRADMIAAGYAPSVRLFEAAACGTPVISDRWAGLGELLEEGKEIFIADSPADVRRWLTETSEADRAAIGAAARRRVLAEHTADGRADQLIQHLQDRAAA
ncbi:CgeB family protein [Alienimonas californiensis]|uniref:Spore protein YkvP/CgeB glycosyl transferase-like domain-containing protein n=1 Tax=Alienimonas californiensis TaxID=2527989 RepID=A0A517P5Q3_9PLAN|nr:glycosyltransferase [Alienimonas californiensis]QDT14701.1 hypothetical protein CA12_07790 [Alienimonas californiensis]